MRTTSTTNHPHSMEAARARLLDDYWDGGCEIDPIAFYDEHDRSPRVYVAGPMRGYVDYNFPAFYEATAKLRSWGFEVFNPAERDENDPSLKDGSPDDNWQGSKPLAYFMQFDLPAVCTSDAVVVLPGWEASQGARLETYVAGECGIPVLEWPTLALVQEAPSEAREGASDASEDSDGPVATPLGLNVIGDGSVLPFDSSARKGLPITSGVIDYFPAALAAVAAVSKYGNDKHNPGEPLHWSRGKSNDHADAIARHLIDRGKVDAGTGVRHSAELAWRALALLQEELEAAGKAPLARGATLPEAA